MWNEPLTSQHVQRYNDINKSKEKKTMAKQTITPSFRLNVEDYYKFKELKEKHNLSWTKFVAYVNALVEKYNKDKEEKQ